MPRAILADPGSLDETSRSMFNHLVGAVQRSLRMCDGVAIPFHGRPEETLVAALAREQGEVPIHLINIRSVPTADENVRAAARHLGVNLVERVLVPAEVDTLDPFPTLAREARLVAPRLLLTEGSEGPFGGNGPVHTISPREDEVAKGLRLQLRYPFEDRGLVAFLRRAGPGPPDWAGLTRQLRLPRQTMVTAP